MLSIVAPVHNEEDLIEEFIHRTISALEEVSDFEIVLVDDGSEDSSLAILTRLALDDERLKVVRLSRNFGHQMAITAGIDHACGDAIVLIDSDLQDPPEVIPEMVEQWTNGAEVVYGVRTERPGESRFKLWTAAAFYWLIGKLADIPLPANSGDFRLLDRRVVDVLKTMREGSRYLRGMVAWAGFRQVSLPYERDERRAGETSFSARKMVKFATDAITSFSDRPLRLAAKLGTIITMMSFALLVWVIVGRLIDPDATAQGLTTILTAVLFLGGVQLMAIGVLGTYIGRIYGESKSRPLYVVADVINETPLETATAPIAERSHIPGP